jgi:hypothetical protein
METVLSRPADPATASRGVSLPLRPRLPDWLKVQLPTSSAFTRTRTLLGDLKLNTVCESAKCPNHWECWSKGTATFMIAGDRCTRACGFCAVSTAKPLALEADEPQRVAEATRRMGLKHVVITAVARDDLADGGAEHFQQTIEAVRALNPGSSSRCSCPTFSTATSRSTASGCRSAHLQSQPRDPFRRLTPSVAAPGDLRPFAHRAGQGQRTRRRPDSHQVRHDARPRRTTRRGHRCHATTCALPGWTS